MISTAAARCRSAPIGARRVGEALRVGDRVEFAIRPIQGWRSGLSGADDGRFRIITNAKQNGCLRRPLKVPNG